MVPFVAEVDSEKQTGVFVLVGVDVRVGVFVVTLAVGVRVRVGVNVGPLMTGVCENVGVMVTVPGSVVYVRVGEGETSRVKGVNVTVGDAV